MKFFLINSFTYKGVPLGITSNKITKMTEIQNIISISVNPFLFIVTSYKLLITDIMGITIDT